jgi:hypothetical protein
MVGVTHNYNNYSILKRHERDKLKTIFLSLSLCRDVRKEVVVVQTINVVLYILVYTIYKYI